MPRSTARTARSARSCSGTAGRPAPGSAAPPAEPVLWAAQLVGRALDIDLIAPADDAGDVEFHDRVSLIASASGIRVRQVTLRDRWWQTDAGPLLARHGQQESPVALIPAGPTAYDIVNPATGERIRVDAAVAAQVAPLAYQFYRSLPNGPVSLRALIRFGARGVRKDVRLAPADGRGHRVVRDGDAVPHRPDLRRRDPAVGQGDAGRLRHRPGRRRHRHGGVQAGAGHRLDSNAGADGSRRFRRRSGIGCCSCRRVSFAPTPPATSPIARRASTPSRR